MKMQEVIDGLKLKRPGEVENGLIESVSISNEDHGALSAWLFVTFSGGGCGFGGFHLGDWEGKRWDGKPFCHVFLCRCMQTVGQGKWENLKGKPLRCYHEGIGGSILAIGNYLKDEWFCPRLEWADK